VAERNHSSNLLDLLDGKVLPPVESERPTPDRLADAVSLTKYAFAVLLQDFEFVEELKLSFAPSIQKRINAVNHSTASSEKLSRAEYFLNTGSEVDLQLAGFLIFSRYESFLKEWVIDKLECTVEENKRGIMRYCKVLRNKNLMSRSDYDMTKSLVESVRNPISHGEKGSFTRETISAAHSFVKRVISE